VDLHSQRGGKRLWTHDVGSHGIFLLMKEPPRERHVLKLTIHLPQGPIGAVAHGTHTSTRGMGVQFFALSGDAKRRWDTFLHELAGAPAAEAPREDEVSESATFVVKMKTREALLDFYEHSVGAGGTYLRTPVLKPVGAHVTLTLVHPATEKEYRVDGTVVRLHQARPKGMEIHFQNLAQSERDRIHEFIKTGERPPPREINIDDDLDLVVDAAEDKAAAAGSDEEMSFDIDIFDDGDLERTPLPKDSKFIWEHVEDELLIDIGLGDDVGTFDVPHTDPEASGPIPVSQEGEPVPFDLGDLQRPSFQVVVRCDSCDMLETELDVGAVRGALGVVADKKPLFCPRCEVVHSVPRAATLATREDLRQHLKAEGPQAFRAPVPVSLLFEVAELGAPPQCPQRAAPKSE
jgi:hypothetical protein